MAAKTRRERELAKYSEGETLPQRCRLFRHDFIKRAFNLAACGITSHEELSVYFGVTPQTIANWRKQYAAFDGAIEAGPLQLAEELAGRMLGMSRDGSESATRTLLERRVPGFRPSAKLDVSTRSDNIAAVLASRGGKPMTEAELIAEGIILPVSEDDPDR